ncbi:MAG: DUF3553 domain-containing protein [Alphaproteobacteria bacterium]
MPAPSAPSFLEPGDIVRLQNHPDWGDGQVQSVIGARVTVNFRQMGKQTINTDHAVLEIVMSIPRD